MNLQAQVQYRYADTAHGTYNSWTELGNMTQNGSSHIQFESGGWVEHEGHIASGLLGTMVAFVPARESTGGSD